MQLDTSLTHKNQWDVAVIGAGPAGSVTARHIAAAGWRVILLDKSEYPGKDAVCGGMITTKDVEIFNIDPSLIEKKLVRCDSYYPWGLRRIRFPETTTHFPVLIQRKHLDRHLAQKAVEAGAELRTKCRVTNVSRVASGKMALQTVHLDNHEELWARLVVFADGPITLARRCFNIGFEPTPSNVAVSVICDFECPKNSMDYWESYYVPEIARWGFGWVFPFAEHMHLGLCFLKSEMNHKQRLLLDRLEFMLTDYVPSLSRVSNLRLLLRRGALIPMGLARSIHDDSCLVVGDAAGFVGTLSGAGISYAMHAAVIAAHVANEALDSDDFSAPSLNRYPRRWHQTRKYKALKIMDIMKKVFLQIHKIDPQALNKLLFLFGVLRSPPEGARLPSRDILRVLLYPLLGNPSVRAASVVAPRKRL